MQSREELILLFKRTVHAAIARNMCTSSLQHLKTKCTMHLCGGEFYSLFLLLQGRTHSTAIPGGQAKGFKKSAFPTLPKQQLAIDRGSAYMAAAIGQPNNNHSPLQKKQPKHRAVVVGRNPNPHLYAIDASAVPCPLSFHSCPSSAP